MLLRYRRSENFSISGIGYWNCPTNSYISGYDESMPERFRKFKTRRSCTQIHDSPDSLMVHTRQPDMIRHKHMYNDSRVNSNCLDSIKGAARLRELPLPLVNRYFAKMEPEVASTNLAYEPVSCKLKPLLALQKAGYIDAKDHLAPYYLHHYQSSTSSGGLEKHLHGHPYRRGPIGGFSPTYFTPAEMADGTKLSIERLLAPDLWHGKN